MTVSSVPSSALILYCVFFTASSEPLSKPYVAFRTDPHDQPIASDHKVTTLSSSSSGGFKRPLQYDEVPTSTCPMHFSLGLAKGVHIHRDESILAPPVLIPSIDGLGSDVLYTTSYEHVHLLKPGLPTTTASQSVWKEVLVEPPRFPLLMESSVFLTSPILHDVNADGLLDVIVLDYDGGLSIIGLENDYRHHAQVPRLYVRRQWVESVVNATKDDGTPESLHDPYHSYFEYYYDDQQHNGKQQLVRGETANLLSQDSQHSAAVNSRRRLEEVVDPNVESEVRDEPDEIDVHEEVEDLGALVDDIGVPEEELPFDDEQHGNLDAEDGEEDIEARAGDMADDMAADHHHYDDYPMYDDGYGRYRGDDMYSAEHNEYYDAKHYLRITPHILADPVHAEIPKLYGNANEKEDMVYVAVSYFFDEDEYDGMFRYKRFKAEDLGDETEVRRGYYVSSAIMVYILGDYGGRWSSQTHLDLSTDHTAPENATIVGEIPVRSDASQMSAMCISSPTVADLDGNGDFEVLQGTSMGFVYLLDARTLMKRENWPVQMPGPVEHQVVVEDVVGDTKLEAFVADINGNVVCLSPSAEVIWHQNWLAILQIESETLQSSSPLALGDVNGDGNLDIVQTIKINDRTIIFAAHASSGKLLEHFPLELDGTIPEVEDTKGLHQKLPKPLLVDLHVDQSFVEDYMKRNGKAWTPRNRRTTASIGGKGPGLHVVMPAGEDLFVIESSTGCTHKLSLGEQISSMVQVDDVHGTNKLDLVVTTGAGNVVTLETEAPYHPSNTWVGGSHRKRSSNHAHGYSASQGIYVDKSSRHTGDIFGVYVPVTFVIFDNRRAMSDDRKYVVEIRDGPSWKRALHREEFSTPGRHTVKVYIKYGPGVYRLSAVLLTSNGILYEDTFTVAYNVGFLDGLGMLLWLPLLIVSALIMFYGKDDSDERARLDDSESLGGAILGRLPT